MISFVWEDRRICPNTSQECKTVSPSKKWSKHWRKKEEDESASCKIFSSPLFHFGTYSISTNLIWVASRKEDYGKVSVSALVLRDSSAFLPRLTDGISSSGPTLSLAPFSLAIRMDSRILSLLPSKSKAHWLREQVARVLWRGEENQRVEIGLALLPLSRVGTWIGFKERRDLFLPLQLTLGDPLKRTGRRGWSDDEVEGTKELLSCPPEHPL